MTCRMGMLGKLGTGGCGTPDLSAEMGTPLFSLSSAVTVGTSPGLEPIPGMWSRQMELDFIVIPLACASHWTMRASAVVVLFLLYTGYLVSLAEMCA